MMMTVWVVETLGTVTAVATTIVNQFLHFANLANNDLPPIIPT